MCSLFGIIDYRGVLSTRQKNKILSILSKECEVRGTDATGIAFNDGNRLRVYKRPLPASKLHLRVPNGVNVIMGHTRLATQGNAKRNFNNHPWSAGSFALAHNGVLWNDKELRQSLHMPDTHIETDSYIAVQLLKSERALDIQALRHMAEAVEGSFVFTVLDRNDNLYFVRGSNPLAIYCYHGFLLYASTADILNQTERKLRLHHCGTIPTEEGDILQIDHTGRQSWGRFIPQHSWTHFWRELGFFPEVSEYSDCDYLLEAAQTMGVPQEEVKTLLDFGYDTDEIEGLLYEPSRLHETVHTLLYT